MEIKDNVILVDWLTFTVKGAHLDFAKQLLGMGTVPWEQIDKYMNGYPSRLFFGGVSILYGATDEMGICINMSGQGCRTYETHGDNAWISLLHQIWFFDRFNVTRLDVAYDDHSGILDIDRIRVDVDQQLYVSKSRNWTIEYGSEGTCIYIGSKKSDMLIRIYDKAAERGYDADTHWVRLELQMRDQIADGFLALLEDQAIGVTFRGVLHNYLRFVEPSHDTNKSRWPLADYWDQLIDCVCQMRCWFAPGVEYNMINLENYVVRQAGSAIDVYLKIWGFSRLVEKLKSRSSVLAPKYKKLLQDYGKKNE